MTELDADVLRSVLGAFVTGVTVVTTADETGRPYGITVNSFSSVSLNPPLILWSLSLRAPSYPIFCAAQWFCVNILAEDQLHLCRRFSAPSEDKFAGVAWKPGLGDAPRIQACVANLECHLAGTFPGGDHKIFLGNVERVQVARRKALLVGNGQYLRPEPLVFEAQSQ